MLDKNGSSMGRFRCRVVFLLNLRSFHTSRKVTEPSRGRSDATASGRGGLQVHTNGKITKIPSTAHGGGVRVVYESAYFEREKLVKSAGRFVVSSIYEVSLNLGVIHVSVNTLEHSYQPANVSYNSRSYLQVTAKPSPLVSRARLEEGRE